MKRRTFLKTAGGAAIAMTLPQWTFGAPGASKPNILFIMTDQQSSEAMSCRIGSQYIKTPNMDSLAAGGMLFTRAYSANPICMPSRTALFTGHYPVETGMQINDAQYKLDPKKFPCMGTIFKNAGYDTGYVGKWHLPYKQDDASLHGFEHMANKKALDDAKPKQAVEFLKTKRDKPFLLVVSFVNPHNICQFARDQALPDGAIGDPPPSDQCPPLRANHEPQKNEPDTITLMRRSYQATDTFPVSGFDDNKWRQYEWAYYRMIEKVDAQIGEVLQALRETGQDKNTVIVFTADHGDCQGSHKWNQKTVFYDESCKVPFIIHYPGATKAGTADRLVNTGIDLIPTLCAYAGMVAPEGMPGLSLMETANGGAGDDPRPYVVASNHLVQGAPIDGVLPTPHGRMLRSQHFKYCVYSEGKRRESLSDMERDPGETVNLAEDPQYKTVLEEHRKLLAEWCRKYNDPFDIPGQS